jgi:hypothetical protein
VLGGSDPEVGGRVVLRIVAGAAGRRGCRTAVLALQGTDQLVEEQGNALFKQARADGLQAGGNFCLAIAHQVSTVPRKELMKHGFPFKREA